MLSDTVARISTNTPLQSHLLYSMLIGVLFAVTLLTGCASYQPLRPPDTFTPSLPPGPKVALVYKFTTTAHAPDSWYDTFENAILQGLREKGYSPIVICGLLRPRDDFWGGYVIPATCPPEFGGSQLPLWVSRIAQTGSTGDEVRAAARDEAVNRGATSILYLHAFIRVDRHGRYFPERSSSLFVQTNELIFDFHCDGTNVIWRDLSDNWLQYSDSLSPYSPSCSVSNVENAQEIRERLVAGQLKLGDRVAVRLEPMEKYIKRLAGAILKRIPSYISEQTPSSTSR